jgi:hypothetical protein
VNTLLADPPAAPSPEQPGASGHPPLSEEAPEGASPAQGSPRGRACAHCGTPLRDGQQWCLQCGACEPEGLGERPNWWPLTALALAAAVLAAGAAVAVAAAFDKHAAPRATTVALVPATPASTTPTATAPATGLPATAGKGAPAAGAGTGSASKGSAGNLLFPPASASKPPKVPAPTATPKATGGATGEATGATGEATGSPGKSTTPAATKTTETGASTKAKTNGEPTKSTQPSPILLDTDAATTYNPYSYPEAGFGDPALAIDGESSTAWTAQVQERSFPSMAEGLLIDLRSATKVGSVALRTPTTGMKVQVYGANGPKAPATITAPGWTQLSSSRVLKKTVTHLKLPPKSPAFRWLVVWIVKAPAASQGTAQAPGHVALSEVGLYPPVSS